MKKKDKEKITMQKLGKKNKGDEYTNSLPVFLTLILKEPQFYRSLTI